MKEPAYFALCRRLSWMVLLCCTATCVLQAQGGKGTGVVWGTVTDASGSVLPGAALTLSNVETGIDRATESLSNGGYTFNGVPVGLYTLRVQATGFNSLERNGIRVNVDEQARVDPTLQVGDVATSVTVTADAGQVETSTATASTVISNERINELPLNGRNPLSLRFFVPGVGKGFNVNGVRSTMNAYTLDGGNAVDGFTNSPTPVPSPDAVEEFGVIEFPLSAQYGRAAGVVVNTVTKSGTNQFHGALWEFLRNDNLNARNFFSSSVSDMRRNQYGGALGGPIVRNKTFFFGSYEASREDFIGIQVTPRLPTDLERQGDFSQSPDPPIDPLTGEKFPGNIIPSSRFDQASPKILEAWVPRGSGQGGDFRFDSPNRTNVDQYIGKVDHDFSAYNRLFGRFFYNDRPNSRSQGNLPGFDNETTFLSSNYTIGDTHTFGPTLTNDFRYTWNRTSELGGASTSFSYNDFGIQVYSPVIDNREFVDLRVNGWFNASNRRVSAEKRTLNQFSDLVSYIRGRHNMKFGVDMRFGAIDLNIGNFGPGLIQFGPEFSKNGLADFLLGRPFRFRQNQPSFQQGGQNEFDYFFQDDWKIAPRLTINLGVRYEPRVPAHEDNDRLNTFIAGQQSVVFPNAPLGLVMVGDPGVPRGTYYSDLNNWAPRIGLAWDVFGDASTSLRAGYGIFYDNLQWQSLQNVSSKEPWNGPAIDINDPGSLTDPYGAAGIADPFPSAVVPTQDFVFAPRTFQAFFDRHFRVGYVQQWRFSLQRQLSANTVVQAAYVGTKGTKLWISREFNVPQYIPGESTLGNLDDRRPIDGFQRMSYGESKGFSSYHSLQLSINKRLSSGISFSTSYTWSKTLSMFPEGRLQYEQAWPLKVELNKGVETWDTPHRVAGMFVWDLPFLRSRTGALAAIVGGWQFTGLATLESGNAISAMAGAQTSLSGTGEERADLIGNTELSGDRALDAKLQEWFNTAAFALPPEGSWGNGGRNILRGPGIVNFDFSLNKAFRFHERKDLQLRVESFNAFNNTNFGTPDNDFSSSNFGRIRSAGSARVFQIGLKFRF